LPKGGENAENINILIIRWQFCYGGDWIFYPARPMLGQLLMEIREYYPQNEGNLVPSPVAPLKIPDFRLMGYNIR